MQYQIFIERPNQNGFVAEAVGVPNCVATGSTEEEAINGIRQALQAKVSRGKFVTLEIESPAFQRREKCDEGDAGFFDDEAALEKTAGKQQASAANPLLKYAGHLKEDPYFDEMMDEIEKYRRELDADLETE